ncbi:hypothetical protein FGADI_11535 [Fusarium gaditjirri]|uniref:Uncharacterized protein n=1 Tax=Fusarium gaditjirri TaxID=282569 RepID=A0A8H4SUZ4_9HYPO|nr:hypothetical protein FGADI_11535 [Fusarium gaditjirri]
MSWKRTSLAETGFFYDEDLKQEDIARFPAHVKSLEQAMLDFTCQELDPPTGKDLHIQREAERLANGGFSEARWVDFFRTFFFNPLLKQASVSGGRSRMSSRCQYYYDSMVFDTDSMWVAFNKNDEKNELVKTPKPDLVFYLPMYHLDTHIPAITDHEAQQWHKASTPSLVEPFSWSTLRKLHVHGLLATPFKIFSSKEHEVTQEPQEPQEPQESEEPQKPQNPQKSQETEEPEEPQKPQKPQEPQERDLSCFPWLIVEFKKAERTPAELERLQEVVYCQAANASGCAVTLNRNAAKYAVRLPDEAQVPPVASVTTVGSQVKVWITFFAKDFMACHYKEGLKERLHRFKKGYRMQCIWTGDMTEPRDIVNFRTILENTYTWAKRVFKPLIATYIDQWKSACAIDIPIPANTEKERRQQRLELPRCALRLALASLDTQPSLKSHDDSFCYVTNGLIDLCDRFVQDVDRVIEEELKRSSGEKPRASSCKNTRRRARTPSEPTPKLIQANETDSNGPKRNGNMDSQPKQSGTPDSADITPLSAPRRSPRLEPRSKPQPSLEINSRVETVSSSLRVAMAAGAPKRRQSQSKYLAPPIESELFDIVADDDVSLVSLSQDVA